MINWQQIAVDLHGKFSDQQVSRICRASNRHTVMNIRIGITKEPRYALGAKLLELHERTIQ